MDTDSTIRTMLHITGIAAEIAAGVTGEGEALAAAAEPPPAHSPVTGLVLLFLLFVALGAYFGGAESAFSAMNRIRVKDSLLAFAGLSSDVVLIGAGFHIEVWSLANRPKLDGAEADVLARLATEAQSMGF